MTYAKRYQVLCLLDLPTTEKATSVADVGFKTYETITNKQKQDLVALAKSRGLTTPPVVQAYCRDITGINLATVGDLPVHLFQEVMKSLTMLEVPVDPNTGEVL